MKRHVIGFFAMLFILSFGSIQANAAEKPNEEEGNSAIVHVNGSGAPNTVLIRADEDISIFLKADGYTSDGKPIYTGTDDATSSSGQE
jgi:hypothetical protein